MKFRIIGLERNNGEPVSIEIDAASERVAQDKAYSLGIVIERVEEVIPKKSNPIIEKKIVSDGSVFASTKSGRVRFFGIPLPFFGSRRNYEERGVNTVGEIAAGVLVGMLLFSCFSPFIVVFILMFLVAWGQAMR